MTNGLAPNSEHHRLELALRAAGLGEFHWDIENSKLLVSARVSAVTGLPEGETVDQADALLERYVHPGDVAAFRAARTKVLRSGETFDTRLRIIRPTDDCTIWLRLAGIIARDASGNALRVTGIVEDVSEGHAEEERRLHLMAELDHRVKNLLATVQALAQQTAKRTTSLDAFLQNFNGRLKAMASANELLTAARWRGAAIGHLAAAELSAIAPGQATWEGPELFLTPRGANALSLALHELAVNAVKFGALSQGGGQVSLRWARRPEGGFELTWTESGGPSVTVPLRRGFGATLLEQVTGRELNGDVHVDYRPAGVIVRMRAGPQAMAERPEVMPDAPVARVTETMTTSDGSASLKGARVLIVEDAVLLALELETGLTDAGAQVVGPAYELEEALSLLDQPIDAAVLDANLNGQSVLPVAEALRRRKIPFVFATGYGEAGGPLDDFDAPVIRKPYDVTQVTAEVAALLAAR